MSKTDAAYNAGAMTGQDAAQAEFAEAQTEIDRLRRRCANQRRELRRLNEKIRFVLMERREVDHAWNASLAALRDSVRGTLAPRSDKQHDNWKLRSDWRELCRMLGLGMGGSADEVKAAVKKLVDGTVKL